MQWTLTARREYDAAYQGLCEHRPEAADAWADDVVDMIRMLENHPGIGHRHRTSEEGVYREVIVGRYRFIYRVTETLLEMRRVLHVRRDYNPSRIREGVRPGFPAFAA